MSQARSRPSTTTLRHPSAVSSCERYGTCSASQRPVGWRTSVARGLSLAEWSASGWFLLREERCRTDGVSSASAEVIRSRRKLRSAWALRHQPTSVICDPSLSRVMGSTSRSEGVSVAET